VSRPTRDVDVVALLQAGELIEAAEWSETHDNSAGYREVLEKVLAHLGVKREPVDD
jgi:hypothetical protein